MTEMQYHVYAGSEVLLDLPDYMGAGHVFSNAAIYDENLSSPDINKASRRRLIKEIEARLIKVCALLRQTPVLLPSADILLFPFPVVQTWLATGGKRWIEKQLCNKGVAK